MSSHLPPEPLFRAALFIVLASLSAGALGLIISTPAVSLALLVVGVPLIAFGMLAFCWSAYRGNRMKARSAQSVLAAGGGLAFISEGNWVGIFAIGFAGVILYFTSLQGELGEV
jgi:hypothetical protein